MSLKLGLQYGEELPTAVRHELEQLMARIQTWADRHESAWVRVNPTTLVHPYTIDRSSYFKYQPRGGGFVIQFNLLLTPAAITAVLIIGLPMFAAAQMADVVIVPGAGDTGAPAALIFTLLGGDRYRSTGYVQMQVEKTDGTNFAAAPIAIDATIEFEGALL